MKPDTDPLESIKVWAIIGVALSTLVIFLSGAVATVIMIWSS